MTQTFLRPEQVGVFATHRGLWHTPARAGWPNIERDHLYRADCGETIAVGVATVIRRPMTLLDAPVRGDRCENCWSPLFDPA
jgi:hypothetical protein